MNPVSDDNALADQNEIRLIVVDDSALVRRTVSGVLREMPGVNVIGNATNGREAIEMIQQFSPDLITLDVEMPIMNGIETLREIKRLNLSTRAVMLSSLTLAGSQVTLDALFEGAFDFIAKPTGGLLSSKDSLQASLYEKINAFRIYRRSHSQAKPVRSRSGGVNRTPGSLATDVLQSPRSFDKPGLDSENVVRDSFHAALASEPSISAACDVVVIGISTGGPQALRHVLPRLESDFPVPVVLVQHMPATYTDTMAKRLDEISPIMVKEAAHGEMLKAGCVFIAPGGRHIKFIRRESNVFVQITDDPGENSCRPSVDYTLRSIAEVYGGRVLTIMMTGMGKDGLEGCTILRRLGGMLFAQDEATSAVYGMPKAVIDAGLVDRILPLGKIAPAITRHVHRSRIVRSS